MDLGLVKAPIYQQLHGLLRRLIREEYGAGDRFLTERQIGQRFKVSRITANKSLAALVAEGVLEFRKGVGTFVRDGVLDYDLRSLVSFTDKARAAGKRPSTKVLRFEADAAASLDRGVRERLGLSGSDRVFQLERLRLADRKPVILERRVVVGVHCPGLTRTHAGGSLFGYWTGRCGLDVGGADEAIRAVNLPGGDARRLGVKPGTAALRVEATGFLAGGEPLWWERTEYRGDAYSFHNRLGGIPAARPAVGTLS